LARPYIPRYFGRVSPSVRRTAPVLALFALTLAAGPAVAEPDDTDADAPEVSDAPPPIARGVAPPKQSRPDVRLDRLELPPGLPKNGALERHLRFQLKRAAHRADWGAKRGAKIEYRVKIEELSVREGTNVVHVRCTAVGILPKGRTTRTFIDYGGNPAQRQKVIEHVLDIVARGVVTRLAAIERGRRAEVANAK
jgi:hypothetical protein